ncbi:MAG: hypothetical protein KF764_33535 [Labilithrix sp.]|nr:hypothetical protein [Labilithrix sp.]
MPHLRRLVVTLATLGSIALVGGCAVDDSGDAAANGDVNVEVDTDLVADRSRPAASCGKNPAAQQRTASELAAFVLGGDNITPEIAACAKQDCILSLRSRLASGEVTVQTSLPLEIQCGSKKLLGIHYELTVPDIDLTTCAITVQQYCDVGPFFAHRAKMLTMDPEPATTKETLGSSTGATAAAVFVNSNEATKVLKWPATYNTGGANPPAAGTPCSPTILSEGSLTTKVIQASGTLRRCI